MESMSPTFLTNARVEEDGCIITSQGPGTVFDFALTFVDKLYGVKKYEEVLKPLVRFQNTFKTWNDQIFFRLNQTEHEL